MSEAEAIHAQQAADDYTHSSVPLRERRDPLTMGLLWVTMVTGFPSVLAGFEWFRQGVSFSQVIVLSIISCGLLLLYSFPACYLGARSGLTYALLSRKVFGCWGSRLVSLNLCWISLSWYGLTAVFLADGLNQVFHSHVPRLPFSIGLAILMAFNNYFGFSGVANFARYAAGPILIFWVLSAFAKAAGQCPSTVWHEPAHTSVMSALTLISAFTIGYSSWGNEADYWRFAKPKRRQILIPLVMALLVGEILFPLTGWMFGRMGGSHSTAGNLMDNFAFGGVPIISAVVLFVTYFAVNDSTLYGAINALENVLTMNRLKVTTILTLTGALAAAVLCDMSQNFERVASLSCIVLPCATVVIMLEQFLISREKGSSDEVTNVPCFADLPSIRWKAVVALLVGCAVGIATAGIFPGSEPWHVGVPALQAWIACLITYLCLRRPARYTTEPPAPSGEIDDKSSKDADAAYSGIHHPPSN
jgi:cytosine permease